MHFLKEERKKRKQERKEGTSFRMAGVALCDIPCVSEGMCVCTAVMGQMLPCLSGKLQQLVFSKVSHEVVMSFRGQV